MRINFLDHHRFEYRYKRKLKQWIIDQLHDLWIRARIRSEQMRSEMINYMLKISREIPKNKKNEHIVYFARNGNNSIIRYYSINMKGILCLILIVIMF